MKYDDRILSYQWATLLTEQELKEITGGSERRFLCLQEGRTTGFCKQSTYIK